MLLRRVFPGLTDPSYDLAVELTGPGERRRSLGVRVLSASILSPRQKACLALVRDGMTSPEIADILGISRKTVDQYVCESLRRLCARSRAQAASEAVRLGEI